MRRTLRATTFVAGTIVLGWLALAGVACERNGEGAESAEPKSAKEANEKAGSAPKQSGSAALPGDEKAGTLEPKSPGPKGPGIFFLAGLKGYLEPCGCTADVLLGGAERLAGYVGAARKLYSAKLMVDAGDTFFKYKELEEHVVPQERAKADVIVDLHNALQTAVMVPGERDFALGADFYRSKVKKLRAELLGANVRVKDKALMGETIREVRNWSLGLVGAVEPELFEGIDEVDVSSDAKAVAKSIAKLEKKNVDGIILIYHGRLKRAKELLEENPQLDFVVIGHGPREDARVDEAGSGYTLEAYDQGRYLGILKLFGHDKKKPFRSARDGSASELEKVKRQIVHVEESLAKIGGGPEGETPPIKKRLQERLEGLKKRRDAIAQAKVEVHPKHKSFVYRAVAMKPGYPIDEKIRKKRAAYNARLKELNAKVEREVPPVPDGEATYIGTNQCATCHVEQHDFWKKTRHGDALATLQNRDKAFDQNCIGCHVVGYDKPGGSVLGKLKYEEEVAGQTMTKDLRNVGCENCHGPGSKHRSQPVGSDGEPQFIEKGSGVDTCMQCHVPEHSPNFEYETYVEKITGEGHERSEASE